MYIMDANPTTAIDISVFFHSVVFDLEVCWPSAENAHI